MALSEYRIADGFSDSAPKNLKAYEGFDSRRARAKTDHRST